MKDALNQRNRDASDLSSEDVVHNAKKIALLTIGIAYQKLTSPTRIDIKRKATQPFNTYSSRCGVLGIVTEMRLSLRIPF